jgi:ankyrin repeat protein
MHIAFFGLLLMTTVASKPALTHAQAREIDELLHKAIMAFDVQSVSMHLEKGANANYVLPPTSARPQGMSMLEIAVGVPWSPEEEPASLDVLRLLFEHGASLQACDRAILFHPVARGHRLTAEFLLGKGADPNATSEGLAMIQWAYAYGHKEMAGLLKSRGARDIPSADAAQLRFVHMAGESYRAEYVVEMEECLKNGATVNEADPRGITAMGQALSEDMILHLDEAYPIVNYLLQRGANPNTPIRSLGMSVPPLQLAILSTRWVCDPSTQWAHSQEKGVFTELIIGALLKAGAHVSGTNHQGQTPLHIAARFNHTLAAKMLIDAGAKIMPRDKAGKTPLDYAESADMIKLLKGHGATEE